MACLREIHEAGFRIGRRWRHGSDNAARRSTSGWNQVGKEPGGKHIGLITPQLASSVGVMTRLSADNRSGGTPPRPGGTISCPSFARVPGSFPEMEAGVGISDHLRPHQSVTDSMAPTTILVYHQLATRKPWTLHRMPSPSPATAALQSRH